MPATEIRQLAEEQFSPITVRRAMEKAGITSGKEGTHWFWRIQAKDGEDDHAQHDHLDEKERMVFEGVNAV